VIPAKNGQTAGKVACAIRLRSTSPGSLAPSDGAEKGALGFAVCAGPLSSGLCSAGRERHPMICRIAAVVATSKGSLVLNWILDIDQDDAPRHEAISRSPV